MSTTSEQSPAAAVPRVPISAQALTVLAADTLVGFAFAEDGPIAGALGLVDWHLCGLLSEAIASKRYGARLGTSLLMPTFGRLGQKRVLVLGAGRASCWTEAVALDLTAAARQQLAALGSRQVGVLLPAAGSAAPPLRAARAAEVIERQFLRAGPVRTVAMLLAA